MTNKPRGTLYIGVTSCLSKRVLEHKSGVYKGFTKKYNLTIFVWFQEFQSLIEAITYEKKVKGRRRNKKIELIEKYNLKWEDIGEY